MIKGTPADGTYWLVEFPAWTWPCHFNPAARTIDDVRRHFPQAGDGSRKCTGDEFLDASEKVVAS